MSQNQISNAKRVVIKVGTSTLTHKTGLLNIRRFEQLVRVLADLKNSGKEIILVSSGAIGVGAGKLGLAEKPKDLPSKQACAAIGQCELMYAYDKLFSGYNHNVAQVLLTYDIMADVKRKKNVINTFEALISFGSIPIVNENDTVSTEEVEFGDNDTLSAIVAEVVCANALVILSDIDGLYDKDPNKYENATLIRRVEQIDDRIRSLAGDTAGKQGTGGMISKLNAAQRAMSDGIPMVVANGNDPHILYDIFEGKEIGTLFPERGKLMTYIEELGKKVKEAKAAIAIAPSAEKNRVLLAISQKLRDHCQVILEANQKDIKAANDNGISGTMIDRLSLNEQRINAIADAVVELTALADPVGVIKSGKVLPNGLRLSQVTVPLGAIGIIYESRPNVTVDAAVMCLKSGNAVMLRGGKEAFHTNQCLVRLMREALQEEGFPSDLIVLVEDTSRETATQMMRLNGMLDVLIPRGGAGLIQSVVKNATLPVIETGTGNCHVYVDASAKIDMAISIVYNAKTSRPSVCNAEESLLVHKSIAKEFLPRLKEALDRKHVILHGCPETIAILGKDVLPATEEDYSKEYLDYEMSVKVVEDISEAIMHIAKYSTGHSDAIVTENYANAQQFIQQVDSAAVYVNASTRFTDGGEFGFGAEIGISTQKLHARGPMGLEALTSSKYVVLGSGQIRE